MPDFGPIDVFRAKKQYLKVLENPHAKTEVFDEKDFAREHFQALGNQYAGHGLAYGGQIDGPEETPASQLSLFPAKAQTKIGTKKSHTDTPTSEIPKAFFIERSKTILIKYSSPADRERNRLSPYLSDFLKQIKLAKADERFAILQELEKFDLGALNPHFNRVDVAEIKAQLNAIRIKLFL